MTWRLRRSEQARADLTDLWLHIAPDNEDAADKLLEQIDRLFRRTADFPRIGKPIDAVAPDHRVLVHGNYMVIYRVDAAEHLCEMVRVLHGARRWQDLIGNDDPI